MHGDFTEAFGGETFGADPFTSEGVSKSKMPE